MLFTWEGTNHTKIKWKILKKTVVIFPNYLLIILYTVEVENAKNIHEDIQQNQWKQRSSKIEVMHPIPALDLRVYAQSSFPWGSIVPLAIQHRDEHIQKWNEKNSQEEVREDFLYIHEQCADGPLARDLYERIGKDKEKCYCHRHSNVEECRKDRVICSTIDMNYPRVSKDIRNCFSVRVVPYA